MDIAAWLRSLGLEQYAPAFRDNGIDMRVLPKLTAEDLKDLGVTMVGHRRVLLEAISSLREPTSPTGSSAPPAPSAPTGEGQAGAAGAPERRQITVMFCDLVGSTTLSARLDPEDLREVIGCYHACAAATVSRFDGFVAKYMGDGVLVYFGYPHAHEDDAEQAVRAGLALVEAVGQLSAPRELQVRIGIASGLVVVGELIGQGSAQEQAIVGETPNLAARLQALAEPNALLIAKSTRRQIGARFELAELGPQPLKGFAEPQRAWRVLAENRALGRFEARRSRATPLVGREEELELLLRRWTQAKAGNGRVVLISGEPGVGKSRLTEALAELITAERHIRVRYFCSPHHQDSALHPVIAQMGHAAGFARDDAPDGRLRKLEALLTQSNATEEEIALIAALMPVPTGERYRVPEMSPQRRKEKTLQALLVQFKRLSATQPVLTIFEDVHWIDPSSLELLTLSVERRAVPVLLLITTRPEFAPPWPGHAHVTTLPLTRLDRRDTAAMVDNIAGNQALLPDIVQEIAERTDGVPLFVEELTRAVLESGAQVTASLSAVPHPGLSVPATLHASLMARLDRLGTTAKDVAQRGSVIGREFGYELLASVADRSEPELREALDRLTNSGLLFARGTVPQSTYIFKHALVQDAAYATMLRSRRQQLHARIAATLEAQFSEIAATQPELLAHHCMEAGLTEKATEYWLAAGRHALASCMTAEAIALLRRGLSLIPRLPVGVSRQQRELHLQIALGQVLIASQGQAARVTGETYDRARQLCEELGRPPELSAVLLGQCAHHMIRAQLIPRARQLAAEIRELGEIEDNIVARMTGYRFSGCICMWLGEFTAARGYFEQGLALYDPVQRPLHAELGVPLDPLAAVFSWSSMALLFLGYLDQAISRTNLALATARRLSHALTLVQTLGFAWVASRFVGAEPALLLQNADEQLALADERGFAFFRANALVQRGWSLAALGDHDDGIPLMTAGLATLRDTGSSVNMPAFLTDLAQAFGLAGRPQAGLECLAEAKHLAEATQTRWVLAETLRLSGDLLLASGDAAAAEASYLKSLALARQQSAKLFELRSATSLARLWRDEGKIADAQALLAPVYAWFTEGFDTPDLVDAKALLGELGRSTPYTDDESRIAGRNPASTE